MSWKKFGLGLIYPHIAVIICLLPVSVAFLVLSLVYLTSTSIVAILSYLLSFYVLVVICFRIPRMIEFFKNFKQENKFMKRWFSDVRLRMKVSLYGSLIWNVTFAIFQLWLGFYHKSFWYFSMFGYYIMLGLMRFFLLKHTKSFDVNENQTAELKKHVLCGWLLLIMNLALAVIVFFVVYLNKTFQHHMITAIAMAAFTFLTFTFAIINLVRFKKYNSPVFSAAKSISLIAACVSMLILASTMLTTFETSQQPLLRQIILSSMGVVVIGVAVTVALIMIVKGTKKLKQTNIH